MMIKSLLRLRSIVSDFSRTWLQAFPGCQNLTQRKRFWLGNYWQIGRSPATVKTSIIDTDCHNIVKPSRHVLNLCVTVVVNILFQIIFIFPLFLGMVMYAYEFKTKEKQQLTEIKNYLQHIYYYYLFVYLFFAVCLRWRLHFEFVLASTPLPAGASPVQLTSRYTDIATWQGPADVDVETMTWDLPIKILPTNPLHASSISTSRTRNTVVFWEIHVFICLTLWRRRLVYSGVRRWE